MLCQNMLDLIRNINDIKIILGKVYIDKEVPCLLIKFEADLLQQIQIQMENQVRALETWNKVCRRKDSLLWHFPSASKPTVFSLSALTIG